MRVGLGVDVHRFGGEPPVLLGGVAVDETRGLAGTSDADVLAHAVTDAVLGAAALGDMGMHFPSSDSQVMTWASRVPEVLRLQLESMIDELPGGRSSC